MSWLKDIKQKNTFPTKEQEVLYTDNPDGLDLVLTLKIRREDESKKQLQQQQIIYKSSSLVLTINFKKTILKSSPLNLTSDHLDI